MLSSKTCGDLQSAYDNVQIAEKLAIEEAARLSRILKVCTNFELQDIEETFGLDDYGYSYGYTNQTREKKSGVDVYEFIMHEASQDICFIVYRREWWTEWYDGGCEHFEEYPIRKICWIGNLTDEVLEYMMLSPDALEFFAPKLKQERNEILLKQKQERL